MLTDQESLDLMTKFVELRTKLEEKATKKNKEKYRQHELICLAKFKYLVMMKTHRYKSFANYQDLNQEGFEALLKAMKTFKLQRGNFFAWAHRYIGTRISRSANLHTTIRYPLKIAKEIPPHRESQMPEQIEEGWSPEEECESREIINVVHQSMESLTEQQKSIISLAYGFDGGQPLSINKIRKKLKIPRANVIQALSDSLLLMKEHIRI